VVGVGEVEGMDATLPDGELERLRDVLRDLLHSSGDHVHD
jgi:hypothetical protein